MADSSDVVVTRGSALVRRCARIACWAAMIAALGAGRVWAGDESTAAPELLAAPADVTERNEARPLPHPEGANAIADQGATEDGSEEASHALPGASGGSNVWMIIKTAGALAVVIGLMVGTKGAIAKWGGGAGRAGAPAGIVTMLARYPLGRKQTMLLVKVDRRILILAQTAEGTSTLSELREAEDVASLLRSLRDAEGESFGGQLEEMLRSKGAVKTARARRSTEGIGAAAARTLLARIKSGTSGAEPSIRERRNAEIEVARVGREKGSETQRDVEAPGGRSRGSLLHEVRA